MNEKKLRALRQLLKKVDELTGTRLPEAVETLKCAISIYNSIYGVNNLCVAACYQRIGTISLKLLSQLKLEEKPQAKENLKEALYNIGLCLHERISKEKDNPFEFEKKSFLNHNYDLTIDKYQRLLCYSRYTILEASSKGSKKFIFHYLTSEVQAKHALTHMEIEFHVNWILLKELSYTKRFLDLSQQIGSIYHTQNNPQLALHYFKEGTLRGYKALTGGSLLTMSFESSNFFLKEYCFEQSMRYLKLGLISIKISNEAKALYQAIRDQVETQIAITDIQKNFL